METIGETPWYIISTGIAISISFICFCIRKHRLKALIAGGTKANVQYFPRSKQGENLLEFLFYNCVKKVFAFALYDNRIEYVDIDFRFRTSRIVFPFDGINFCAGQDEISVLKKSCNDFQTIEFRTQSELHSWYLFLKEKIPDNNSTTVINVAGNDNTVAVGSNIDIRRDA